MFYQTFTLTYRCIKNMPKIYYNGVVKLPKNRHLEFRLSGK
jgi:hypothetical protein